MACDDMVADPNLSDQCIFINDGPAAMWWMSPDINLNGFSDVAKTGQNNTVDVTVHRGPDNAQCSQLTASNNIIVEVWASAPGLNLSPVGAKNLGTKLIPKSQLPPNGQRSLSQAGGVINWTPSTNASDPDGPGHRCLISRCYPETDGPPQPDCFHVRGDTHVAQRNITIQIVAAPRPIRVKIRTLNANVREPQLATFAAVTDPNPDRRVLNILAPGLKNTGVFERVATKRPARFSMALPDFPKAKIRDHTRPGLFHTLLGGLGASFRPSYEADVHMKPGQITTFDFVADLSKGQRGDAYIFYLTHVRSGKQVIGGLTFVAVIS